MILSILFWGCLVSVDGGKLLKISPKRYAASIMMHQQKFQRCVEMFWKYRLGEMRNAKHVPTTHCTVDCHAEML